MNIRIMQMSDFQSAYALWQKTGISLVMLEKEKIELETILTHNPSSCFVAVENKQVIGTILGTFNGRRAWIYHVAVHPKCQNRGYGSALLQHTETMLQVKNATKILLAVGISNLKTVPFYEKNGYHVINDAVLMAKDI